MVESAYERLRKRIVEATVSGFTSARDAITFGNTVEKLVADKAGIQKYRQQIGAPDTILAITPEWEGATVLKMTFLELRGTELAQHILKIIRKTATVHNEVHRGRVRIDREIIREKPQPQTIG